MICTLYRTILLCTLPYLLQAQFVISSPQARSVIQRDVANRAQLVIAGTAPRSASAVEARLIPMVLGQGTPINWRLIATVNKDNTFRGTLTALGGWYRVEIRAKTADGIMADTVVNRVGVGEVFIIAGQSNAQGGVVTDVPAAIDDRVSCVDLFQRNQVDSQLFPFLFSHVSAGASIGPSNSPYLWGILGDSLVKRLNVPILFLGAAQGGTNSSEWKNGAAATPNTAPYLRISALFPTYINRLGVRAVLWHQGESDGTITEPSYFGNLSYVIDKSRQQLNHNRLAWIVSRASYISGATNGNVIAAQNRLSREVADVYPGPATDALVGPTNRVDDIHFGGQGLVRVANLWNQSLSDLFFSQSTPFIPAADTIRIDKGWQPVVTGTPSNTLQRIGYRYESSSHNFFLLVSATTPCEGRLERLDAGGFTDTAWLKLALTTASSYNGPGFSDYGYLRFYAPSSGVLPGRYRLSVRPVGNTDSGYQFETVLSDFRNTLFIGNDPIPTLPTIQEADLSLAMETSQQVIALGQPVTHYLTVQNKSGQRATGVRLQSRLPAGLSFIDSPQASVTARNGVVTAVFDTLLPYTTARIDMRTIATVSGRYNTAAQLIATDQFDPNSQPGTGTADGEDDMASDNFRTIDGDSLPHISTNPGARILPAVASNQPTPVSSKADLSLSLQTSHVVAVPGNSLTVVCAISNSGGLTATNVAVQLVLPTGWQLIASDGLTVSGQTVTGTLAQLSADATAKLTFVIRASSLTTRADVKAQILRVDQADPDSTPGNGFGQGEDDESIITIRVPSASRS